MKIVVIGGTGLIGSKLVELLRAAGHEAVPASPGTGVNTITGEGLADVLAGADVVVDVANSPSFEDHAVLEFFQTSGKNLLAAEAEAGVGHHVALSIVGTDRAPDSGYLRAKVAQEALVKDAGIPYTIVRATQFFEFAGAIAQSARTADGYHLSPGAMQPIAAAEVSATLADVAPSAPLNGTVDLAGPERFSHAEFVRRWLEATEGPEAAREVRIDPEARYFGTRLDDTTIVPTGPARIGAITFAQWLAARG
ncbi:SDR family oxidoreductase [Dactylosporangium sp. AC04546]|uniref:SDR family oxidoreductase n=1 Tax=Dactylosporangium sp. AC04546 TaxID=2862460 RepID=UPI001EDCFB81|nr:SDR family oxidoreductase [Dactylosporangium sp. AC04546]WVK87465.1 SDR family oxidoreductase [Dactylosporangium sp. AC04546]